MSERVRLFGTDGIRGQVPHWPLTADFVVRLGQAIAEVIREGGYPPLVVIGRDTRCSGPMLESALAAGLMERGLDVLLIGIMPTPAVALLARHFGAGLGIVLSASHNPYPDNGIKLFASTGFKIADELEREIERCVQEVPPIGKSSLRVGRPVSPEHPPEEVYLQALLSRAGQSASLQGWHLVLDCAQGATYQVAPELFHRLGARVTVLYADPDGEDINRGCGSEHPEALCQAVLRERADAGVAFDGDGDRLLLVDEKGSLLDGDVSLFVLARELRERGQLRGDTVVATVMSNLGLEQSLGSLGVRLERVSVGDRYVVQRMLEGNFALGGESSGHVILLGEGSTTADGLYTALRVLGVAGRQGKPLSKSAAGLRKCPQVLLNVPVPRQPPLESLAELTEARAMLEAQLDGNMRILLRYSGTQPLLRVMVEGEQEGRVRWAAEVLADAAQRAIPGAG